MKENNPQPKFKKLTTVQIVEIHGLLQESIIPMVDGLVCYKEGVSDRTLAGRVGAPQNHVARVRVETFGKLVAGSPRSSPGEDIPLLKERVGTPFVCNKITAVSSMILRLV